MGMAAIFTLPFLTSAANASQKDDQEQEYIQVRKIALKDSRVQEAFEKANERLDERILEIDPTLKSYMEKHDVAKSTGHEAAKPATPEKRTTAPTKRDVHPSNGGATHEVKKGETLSSIAADYKVNVASLKSANNITDERKLHVGQKLVIPTATTGGSEPRKDDDFWTRLKNSFD
jgi:LysM repeat protein